MVLYAFRGYEIYGDRASLVIQFLLEVCRILGYKGGIHPSRGNRFHMTKVSPVVASLPPKSSR
jgi:hypothetical protein